MECFPKSTGLSVFLPFPSESSSVLLLVLVLTSSHILGALAQALPVAVRVPARADRQEDPWHQNVIAGRDGEDLVGPQ